MTIVKSARVAAAIASTCSKKSKQSGLMKRAVTSRKSCKKNMTQYSSLMIRLHSDFEKYLSKIILSFHKNRDLLETTRGNVYCNVGLYYASNETLNKETIMNDPTMVMAIYKNKRFKSKLYAPGADRVQFFTILNDSTVNLYECVMERTTRTYFQQLTDLKHSQKQQKCTIGWVVSIENDMYIQILDKIPISGIIDNLSKISSEFCSVGDFEGLPVDMLNPPSYRTIFPDINVLNIEKLLNEKELKDQKEEHNQLIQQIIREYLPGLSNHAQINPSITKQIEESILNCVSSIKQEYQKLLDDMNDENCETESE